VHRAVHVFPMYPSSSLCLTHTHTHTLSLSLSLAWVRHTVVDAGGVGGARQWLCEDEIATRVLRVIRGPHIARAPLGVDAG
jgi:hypothetical protein